MSRPLRIVTIPSRDEAFAVDARCLAERIPAELEGSEAARAWFEAELRRSYPGVTVRIQDELARTSSDPDETVWYVTNNRPLFRIDTSVEVPLALPEAYAVYVDRVVEWQTAVALTPVVTTPELVGTEYAARYEFLGRRYTGRFRVVAAVPLESVSLEAEGSGIRVWYVTRFAALSSRSTLVAVTGDYRLPDNLLARIADRLFLERSIARDVERANDTYRAMCEAVAKATKGA